jgi:uncharacterized protein (TIGR02599 family)
MKKLIHNPASPVSRGTDSGFTLVELLVAAGILSLLVALLLNMVTQTSKTWKATSGKIEQFREARDAFDSVTRRVSQATLNSYLDYDNPTNPTSYVRKSELRFLSGPSTNILGALATNITSMAIFFQAPNGFSTNSSNSILQNALNTWGYFIEYAADTNSRPGFLPTGTPAPRYRYRLMELMEPTESLSIYNYTSGLTNSNYTGIDWIANSLGTTSNRPAHVVAENVIAMILLPKISPNDQTNGIGAHSLATNYVYDSSINMNSTVSSPSNANAILNTHNQLPPVVQVTLIAVDEASAIRFPNIYSNIPLTFSSSNWFSNAAAFQADLSNCQIFLSKSQINFRVFTTDVMLKGAKWSSSQTN